MIKLAVTNLGKYNEGTLVYEWLTLPATPEEINATYEAIGLNEEYEECFITDWECEIEGIEINEYSNIESLNEIAERLEEIDDIEVVEALMDTMSYSLDEAIDEESNAMVLHLEKNTMLDDNANLAYAYIESIGCLEFAVNDMSYYFDYEAFGRDLRYDLDCILENFEEEEKEEYYNMSDDELASWYIDTMMGDIKELGNDTLERYFDYETFGRDLSFDFSICEKHMIAVSCC